MRRSTTGNDAPARDEARRQGLSRQELLKRAGVAGIILAAPGSAGLERASAAVLEGSAKAGGTLRVGLNGGTSTSRDPQFPPGGNLDIARAVNLYERLLDYDGRAHVVPKLATSVVPRNKNATQWVIKLRKGVLWHDGSHFTPEDVIYSLKRIATAQGTEGAAGLAMIDPEGLTKLDASSVLVKLKFPYSDLAGQLALRPMPMVKAGTTDFTNPNGTGPFKFDTAVPGQLERYVANKNYWVSGRPYVDAVELHVIEDSTARLNALIGNQIDAMNITDASQIPAVKSNGALHLQASPSDGFNALCMNTQVKPYNDVRVRQAIRLIADRPQLIKTAMQGYGIVLNDMFFKYDPSYPTSIPQRHQDLEQAKFLLKKAGRPTLDVTLDTADALTGMLAGDIVLSQQAKSAGLNLKIVRHDPATYWTTVLGKRPFVHDAFSHAPFLNMCLQALLPSGPVNKVDTNWNDPKTTKLVAEAARTVNPKKRTAIIHEIDQIQWNRGGYLIWGGLTWFDAYRTNVKGVVPNAMRTLGDFRFQNLWLA
jgi:peptide/nickel transport system substrate-binding protein